MKWAYVICLFVLLAGCCDPAKQRAKLERKRQIYFDTHPLLDSEIKNAILADRIRIGMTVYEVGLAWNYDNPECGGRYWHRAWKHSDGLQQWDLMETQYSPIMYSKPIFTFNFGTDGKLTDWFEW